MNKELEHQKTLYSLNNIFDIAVHQGNILVDIRTDYETVKSALERKEKLEKVWEIIKEKKVNLYLLNDVDKCHEYNWALRDEFISYEERLIDFEEFNLLKEMLGE